MLADESNEAHPHTRNHATINNHQNNGDGATIPTTRSDNDSWPIASHENPRTVTNSSEPGPLVVQKLLVLIDEESKVHTWFRTS